MTNINVEVGELMRLSSRSEELNSDISSTFNGINNVLDNISGIVRSDTLTGANDIQKDGVNTLMVRIDENLRNIKIFLDNQIKNYTVSVEDALNSLNTLIAAINGAYGVNSGKSYTSFTTDKSTSDNVSVESGVQGKKVETNSTTTSTEKNYTVSSTPYNANDSINAVNPDAKTSSDNMNKNLDALGTWDNVSGTYDFFKEKGLTDEQIAGIMGNAYAESKFKLDAKNPNSSATGIFQWLNGRQPSDWSLNGQLEHAWNEIANTRYNGKVISKLQECTTPSDAAYSFAKWFEGYTENVSTRQSYAEAFYDYIKDRNGVKG